MKLTLEGISDRKEWEQKGYKLPEYNIEKMRENTKSKPFWIHFGAGNLFLCISCPCSTEYAECWCNRQRTCCGRGLRL